MKIPCGIIRDLLPLYHDNVCSEESKDMVEEHLSECEDCRSYYEQFDLKLPEITENSDDSSSFQADLAFIRKVESRITRRQLAIFSITVIIISFFLVLYASVPTENLNTLKNSLMKTFPVLDTRISTDKIEVKDVYRLDNGYIYCTFDIHSYVSNYFLHSYVEKNNRGNLEVREENNIYCNALSYKKFWSDFYKSDSYVSTVCMVVPEDYVYRDYEETTSYATDGLYYVGKGEEILTLWDGSEIPEAPESVEQEINARLSTYEEGTFDALGYYFDLMAWNERTD